MLDLDPEKGIGYHDETQRAAWVEAAVSMLRECEPDDNEVVLMGEPPEKVDGENLNGVEEIDFAMGHTYINDGEKTVLRIREVVSEDENIRRFADYYPESKAPERPNFPHEPMFCIFDFESCRIYEWPTENTTRFS